MTDYETYCKIKQMQNQQLRISQIAHSLGIDERTAKYWADQKTYHQRKATRRAGKLDPYKPRILELVEKHPYTSVQINRFLQQEGYQGGLTILKDFVRTVRPRKSNAFLTLSFAPGECAQVDWGQYGTIQVGSTRRRLSFFVMVLCYSRMMYLEFTVLEKMEQFLTCHQNAFEFFGAVPEAIMVDNLKCAVLKRLVGNAPVFNPKYLEFSSHYGFSIRACNVRKGNEKGRVENGVGYVKKNFLAGLEIPDFSMINPTSHTWLDQVANVRVHGTTHERPVDLFALEKPKLQPLPVMPYDIATPCPARANKCFRIELDSNRYSVPSEYAGARLTLKAYNDRICIYSKNNLIARHERSYDRNQDIENPDHPRALLQHRRKAKEQRLLMQFLKLSSKAEAYYGELANRRLNPKHHIRQIVALSEIYGAEKVARAIEDAFTFQAFSCEYIANILEQRERMRPQAAALHVTRRQDLLELDLPEPDLSIYDEQEEPKSKENRNGQE